MILQVTEGKSGLYFILGRGPMAVEGIESVTGISFEEK